MPVTSVGTRDIPLTYLTRFPGNARRGNVTEIRKSIRRNGQYRSIVVRQHDDGRLVILAGNHTAEALTQLAADPPTLEQLLADIPERFREEAEPGARALLEQLWAGTARCEIITCTDAEAIRINLADNRLSDIAEDDTEALAELLASLDGDIEGTGWDPQDLDDIADALGRDEPDGEGPAEDERPSLADRFLIPPFDVLDARQGWWRERKKTWLGLGIQSELGRGRSLLGFSDQTADIGHYAREKHSGYTRDAEQGLVYTSASGRDPTYYTQKTEAERQAGRTLTPEEFEAEFYDPAAAIQGTSIFDPVLCELGYRWFSAPGASVLDPFAGGSVRGLMAAMLGRSYTGNDLSAEQIKANSEQADSFAVRGLIDRDRINWSTGDSADWVATLPGESFDLLFTCPPYLWLEKYSDDPADLSRMGAGAFEEVYTRILAGCAAALRPDRFAVIVTGDVRDRTGRLVDFRAMTIRAAESGGLMLASGAVLVTPVGSLAVRAPRSFEGTRVLGRTHQDVLVFCKGDRKRAAKAAGEIDLDMSPATLGSFAADDEAGGDGE